MTLSISKKALPRESSATAVRGQVKEIGGRWPPGFHPLPFQALRASFPEGKPSRETFETFTMKTVRHQPHFHMAYMRLTDKRNSG